MSNRNGSASLMLAMAVAMNGMDGRMLMPAQPSPEPKGADGNDMYRLMRAAEKRKQRKAKRVRGHA